LTTGNRTAPITNDGTVIPSHFEAATSSKDVLECISTVKTDLKHSAVEAEIRIYGGRFKVEVVSKGQFRCSTKKV
jgi:hypothetical protein